MKRSKGLDLAENFLKVVEEVDEERQIVVNQILDLLKDGRYNEVIKTYLQDSGIKQYLLPRELEALEDLCVPMAGSSSVH